MVSPFTVIVDPIALILSFTVMEVPVAVSANTGVVFPIAPPKLMWPEPAFTVRICCPLIVSSKMTFALVEVMTLVPMSLTGTVNVRGLSPETVMLFPTSIRLALVKVMSESGVVPPTIPVNEITPAPAARVRAGLPLRVFVKERLLPFELMVLVPVSRTGLEKSRGFVPFTEKLLAISIRAPLLKIRLAGGVLPPTIPLNAMTPLVPAARVRAVLPLRVLLKVMFAPVADPFALLNVGVLAMFTAPLRAIAPPAVRMLALALTVVPASVTVPPAVVMVPFALIVVPV